MKSTLLAITALTCSCLPIPAAVVLSEAFSCPDGSLVGVSGTQWATHSGTTGQADISAGRLQLTQAESEDVNAPLAGQPYAPAGGVSLYVKLNVSFSELPRGTGGYFAHFNAASNQRGRFFATTNGAAPGTFRVGVAAAASSASAVIGTDLSLNAPYVIVGCYSVADGLTRLWLNPAAESAPSVASLDSASPATISVFAFRQSLNAGNGMGTLTVDDLIVGTAFADVVSTNTGPGSIHLSAGRLGTTLVLRWTAEAGRDYAVERSNTADGTFEELATGLRFGTTLGGFTVPDVTTSTTGFFRVRTP